MHFSSQVAQEYLEICDLDFVMHTYDSEPGMKYKVW